MDGKFILLIIIPVFCIAWQAQCAVNCSATGPGRFADPDDTKCKNYTFYIFYPPSYVSYNYTCPSMSLFNPKTAKCTTKYTCNSTTTNSTNTSNSCKEAGRFPDLDSSDFSGYIECVYINGAYLETKFRCFNNTYFNPNNTNCEFSYKCPSSFTCKFAGRFPTTSDKTCNNYYFCILLSDGILSTSIFAHQYPYSILLCDYALLLIPVPNTNITILW